MAHLPLVHPATAATPVSDLLAEVQRRLGTTPNMTRAMASSPALLKAWLDLSGALSRGVLDLATQERIALASRRATTAPTVCPRTATSASTSRTWTLTRSPPRASDGVPRVAGHPWNTIKATQAKRAVAAPPARLAGYRGPERFDVLNLLVATDGAVAELNADIRRLRPNGPIGGVPLGTEHPWPGHELVIGEAITSAALRTQHGRRTS